MGWQRATRNGPARQGTAGNNCYTIVNMTSKHRELIALRLPPALLKKIDRLAKQEDRSRSSMTRRLVEYGLAKQKPSEVTPK